MRKRERRAMAVMILAAIAILLILITQKEEPPQEEAIHQELQEERGTTLQETPKEIYVPDSYNNRIQVFDHEGKFIFPLLSCNAFAKIVISG